MTSLHLGEGVEYDGRRKKRLTLTDRQLQRGVYCQGSSRSGKTNLAKNLMSQCLALGVPFCSLDLEGSTQDHLIRLIVADADRKYPKVPLGRRYEPACSRYAVFCPTDDSGVIPFNWLAPDASYSLFETAQYFIAALKRVWPEQFALGARMEDVFRSAFLVLGEQHLSVQEFDDLFLDPRFAETLAFHSKQPALKFWTVYRAQLAKTRFREWIESARNKVSEILSSPYLAPMFSTETCVDFSKLMDDGKTVLIRLEEDRLGDQLPLLATLLLARIELDSAKRQEGASTYITFLDEFQEYPSDCVHRIMSRRQKRGLGLCVFHQNRAQIDWKLLSAIMGNCGTRIAFSLGDYEDAEKMARQLFPLRGDRIKRQKAERLWGIVPVPTGEPSYWSVGEELAHYANQIKSQRVGEAVACYADEGKTYWLRTPLSTPPPRVPAEHIAAFMETNARINLVSIESCRDAYKRRREHIAEMEQERKEAEIEDVKVKRAPRRRA
jgi:hypothetical protein